MGMMTRTARRDLIGVFLLALVARVVLALPQQQPGYMDAYYYTVGGQQLAGGRGFSEAFIWNYLDQPAGLPRPSHQYWMPLPSVLAALGMLIGRVAGGALSFRAAQAPFILLSALVPVIAYVIAWQACPHRGGRPNRRQAWAAAALTIFSGFFMVYWPLPETFAPFAVFGALAIWASARGGRWALAAGLCAGLAHLTRADGVLLLLPALLAPVLKQRKIAALAPDGLWVILGYVIIISPWLVHNWLTTGRLLSTAGAQTMFLTNYDDLFSLDKPLNLSTYLAWGAGNILRSKLDALWANLQTLVAGVGMVFLAPFAALGLWRQRRDLVYQSALIYGAALYLVMSLVFTFPGARGGMFHSGAALLPFACAAALAGLDAAVAWAAARIPTWEAARAQRGFTLLLLLAAVLFSGFVYAPKALNWNRADAVYAAIGRAIGARLAGQLAPLVMVNNAPGYVYHTGQPAISIPNGDVETLLAAARRFGAQWVVLDKDNPSLASLYAQPGSEPRLALFDTFHDDENKPVYLFKLKDAP